MVKKENKKENKNIFEEFEETTSPQEEIREEGEAQISESESNKEDADQTVTIPLSEYAAQLEEIDHLNQKADEFSDGWQRERADFTNYRKRMGRDLDVQKINYKVDVIKKYLAVKDDLDRALKNMPESLIGEPWVGGIQLISQKLSNLLDEEGIQVIPAEGIAFDPEMHEAISHEDNPDVESGFIIEVVQQGYAIGERVIRPSLVRVAK
ncbi:MAG: nucleotide exchange factor GrpE [Pelolinea sp.]|nr:nucleotide exchange factor GrpE [Pelolinea sp.]